MSTQGEVRSRSGALEGLGRPLSLDRLAVLYPVLLAMAIGSGVLLRLRGVLAGFPLFDGGMFLTMIGDVQANGYRLPVTTSYNGGDIPFSYPPFAFYLAAGLNDLAGVPREDLMQVLPAVASAATIGGFYLLADSLLKQRWAVLAATFVFATLPASFSWMIVGGGLTRSLGFLFAVLALGQLHRMYTRPRPVYIASSALFVSLTVLSHLEMTLFLGLSAAVLFAFFGQSSTGTRRTLTVAAVSLMLTAPWWVTVMSREGLSPWLDTGASRPVLSIDALGALLKLDLTYASSVDLAGLLATLGILVCVLRREYFLPCWLLAIALLAPWVFTRLASVPVALLAGRVLVHDVWPWLRDGLPGTRLRPPAWIAACLAGALVISSGVSAVRADRYVLVEMSDGAREAMQWSSQNTSQDDRFLVITGRIWYHDYVAEWFPTLAQRESAGTIQGREWLGDFDHQVDLQAALRQCAHASEWCIERWTNAAQTGYDYVYVSREAPPEVEPLGMTECCAALRVSLLKSPDYSVVYENSAATIFVRNGRTANRDASD